MSDSDAVVQTELGAEKQIEIKPQDDNLWTARLHFALLTDNDLEMVSRMREAKRLISQEFCVPLDLLEFREVVEKSRTPEGITALVTIGRIEIGRGNPVVSFRPQKAPGGEVFEDMIAEMDFYYLDEFDQKITLERLNALLDKHGIPTDMRDQEVLEHAIVEVRNRRSFVNNLVVARGRLPEAGRSAEIEYTFHTDPGAARDLAEYRTSRKVSKKDILCQKTPPRDGRIPGRDVHGQRIPPLRGLDFDLVAGDGAKLSLDGCTVTAQRDGLAIMTRATRRLYTLIGEKVVPSRIEIMVKPVVSLRPGDQINLALEDSVEISGNLKRGSSIITQGEVFLGGDMEKDAQIRASEDVMVEGWIDGGSIASDHSVLGLKGAKDANISASQNVELRGLVENSEVSACRVDLNESKGSRIVADRKVTINQAGSDSAGKKTTIRVAWNEFYRQRLESNREAVNVLNTSLQRIEELFGNDVINTLDQSNAQRLLVKHLKRLRRQGYRDLDEDQIQSLKKLLQSVSPLRGIIAEKSDEMKTLQEKTSDGKARKPVVVIREKIQDDVEITLDGITQTIPPSERGLAITVSPEGSIRTYPLLPRSSSRPPMEKS